MPARPSSTSSPASSSTAGGRRPAIARRSASNLTLILSGVALSSLTAALTSLAINLAPKGIRVNTLCPTFIRTPLAEQSLQNPERRAWILSKIKLGRVGEVEDLMGPVVFLASEASAMVTGTHLIVDGGWTAE